MVSTTAYWKTKENLFSVKLQVSETRGNMALGPSPGMQGKSLKDHVATGQEQPWWTCTR